MSGAAVILTHSRPELLAQCVAAIRPQVDQVIVIDNASDPPAVVERGVTLVQIPDQPPNLARFWNIGIAMAEQSGAAHIAVLCDDAIVPDGWFAAVTAAMLVHGAAVGCSDPWGHLPAGHTRVKTEPDSAIMERMPGHAWVLDPASGVRGDERLMWWYCDTKLDMDCRRAGGMAMIGGYLVPNVRPNDFTNTVPGLAEQAGKDGATYAAIEGSTPW